MKKKIIVTGGAGFIGSHTVVALIEAGFEPIIIDNFANSNYRVIDRLNELTGHKITLWEENCLDRDNISKRMALTEGIAGIIHFAADKAVGESVANPLKYYENNIQTLVVMLGLCKTHNIDNFVFSSSCTVYGEPDVLPVSENASVKPAESPYGKTKQFCEEIIKDFVNSSAKFKAICLRYFNPIGAHKSALIGELPIGKPNNLVPFITQTAIGIREKLTIFGDDYPTHDGTNIRDYIHVVDLALAHVSALKYIEKVPEPTLVDFINIGTGKGNSVLEVVQAFMKANKVDLNYEIGPRRSGDIVAVYADAKKAKDLLGWETKLTLEDALVDAWRWEQSLENKVK